MSSTSSASASKRIDATPEATALVERLVTKFGPLMFHQTGNGTDGAAPMCYPEDEFFLGHCDVCIGAVAGTPFYLSEAQFEVWQHEHLTLDVASGRGGTFSLENGEGVRFVVRGRPFTMEERLALKPARRGCPDAGPAHDL